MPPKKKRSVVSEPIQVYLTSPDRELLDRAAVAAGLSRAEVLRRGLRSFAATALADNQHPVIAFLDEMAAAPWPADTPTDLALHHDEYLAEFYAEGLPLRPKARRSAK